MKCREMKEVKTIVVKRNVQTINFLKSGLN